MNKRTRTLSMLAVALRLHSACVLMLCSLSACNEEHRYIGVYEVVLDEDTEPLFESEDGAIYIIEERIVLPIGIPSDTALQDLTQAASAFEGLPFPRLPWVERGDLAIQVDFTLTSQDDQPREVAVIVNGLNEFHEYQPGVIVIDDEPTPDYSQWERLYEVQPGERMSRTVREEEFDEMTTDLATVVNDAPNSNRIVFFENKSGSDPRDEPFIPKVIPGLVGFRIGMRTTDLGRVTLKASVRVRDVDDRLANPESDAWEIQPQPFMPVAPEAEE